MRTQEQKRWLDKGRADTIKEVEKMIDEIYITIIDGRNYDEGVYSWNGCLEELKQQLKNLEKS